MIAKQTSDDGLCVFLKVRAYDVNSLAIGTYWKDAPLLLNLLQRSLEHTCVTSRCTSSFNLAFEIKFLINGAVAEGTLGDTSLRAERGRGGGDN